MSVGFSPGFNEIDYWWTALRDASLLWLSLQSSQFRHYFQISDPFGGKW
jgi:hypothetical protein